MLIHLTADPYIGGLADLAKDADIFPYSEIPGFPQSTVAGHVGRLPGFFRVGRNSQLILVAGSSLVSWMEWRL